MCTSSHDTPERDVVAPGQHLAAAPGPPHAVVRADSSNTCHFVEQCRSGYGATGETEHARWIRVHPSLPARVYLKDPVTTLSQRAGSRAVSQALDAIDEHAGKTEVRWLLWRPPRQDAVEAALLEAGFTHRVDCPGMTKTNLACETAALAPLSVSRVATHEEVSEWARIYTEANGFPETVRDGFHDALPEAWSRRSDSEWFIGRTDGGPVACVKLRLESDRQLCGLYQLATLERFRRRGFGAYMLTTAMQYARARGYASALLQSEPHAAALYERLGFTRDCTMEVWIRPVAD